MSRIFAFIAAGFLVQSCGSRADLTHLADTPRQTPVVAVLSGYGTCGLFGSPQASPMVSNGFFPFLQRYQSRFGQGIPYVISCFNGFAGDKIRFSSTANRAIRQVDWNDSGALVDEIIALATHNPDAPLTLVSHSYGAWIAMQAVQTIAQKLLEAGDRRSLSLVTIDPISPTKCAQGGAILGSFRTTVGLGAYPGCDTWPDDLDARRIREDLMVWKNFYQETFIPVHSSPIPVAENQFVPMVNSLHFGGAHTDVAVNVVPWTAIGQLLGL